MNKKFAWWILVIVIIVGVGSLFLPAKKTGTTYSIESASSEKSDWKTGIIKSSGLSFEYPSSWEIKEKPADSSGITYGYTLYSQEGAPLMTINTPIRETGYEGLDIIDTKNIVVNGNTFTVRTFADSQTKTISQHITWNENNWSKSGEIWSFVKSAESDEILEQILSSLKFTK